MAERRQPESGIFLAYITQPGDSSSTGDAGDPNTGLDPFGRIVDQRWVNGSGASVDRYLYGYDADSNRSSKTNTTPRNSETYTYDGLNRLTGVDGANGTANDQTWSLDALGNMSTVTTAGVTDYRQTNSRNQLLSMNSTSTTVTAGS